MLLEESGSSGAQELCWELEDELLEEEELELLEEELELLLDLGSNSNESPPLPNCSTNLLLPPPGTG
ncbi:hypothetical protein ABFY27_08410 [Akkermansia massiliensis]